MSKKRIIALVASLLIIFGIGYGAYASLTQNHSATASTSQVSKKKTSSKDAQPQEIGLKGKAKVKKSAKTTKASKKAESIKAESEKKVAASQASSSQKVAAQKAAQASSTKQVAQQQADATSTSRAAVQSKQAVASQATKQPTANTNQQSQATTPTAQPTTKKVTVSVYGPMTEGNQLIVNHDSVAMNDGETVIDILKRDMSSHGMALSYKGTGSAVYVKGINGLFEFDKGSQSGWIYQVNGTFPSYSCGSYTVKSGDVINWMYTESLGNDRHAPQG